MAMVLIAMIVLSGSDSCKGRSGEDGSEGGGSGGGGDGRSKGGGSGGVVVAVTAVGQWLVSGFQWSSSAQQSLAARQKRVV